MESWSIIVLCYSEEKTIEKTVEAVQFVLDKMRVSEREIIIVDDGSEDTSFSAIKSLKNKFNNIKMVRHSVNLGIGASLLSGYRVATKENVCAIPGDGQFDVKELMPYASLKNKTFISFFREKNTSYSFFRVAISKTNRFFNKFFLHFNLQDVNWVKVYKRKVLNDLKLELTSSLVESEICAKLIKLGFRPLEVPSRYLPRIAGKSKGSSPKMILQAVLEMYKLFVTVKNFRV